jgi:hypothetical protein
MNDRPDLGAPDIRHHYLKVTNLGDTDFVDMFDGVPIHIDRRASQNLDLATAAHLFGYGYQVTEEAMFKHTQRRQGWNTKEHREVQPSGKTLAQELFARFKFEPKIYKMVEDKPDLDRPIPADPQIPTAAIEQQRMAGETIPPVVGVNANAAQAAVEEIPPLPPRRKAGAA